MHFDCMCGRIECVVQPHDKKSQTNKQASVLTHTPAYSLIPHIMYVNASNYKMSCVQPIKHTHAGKALNLMIYSSFCSFFFPFFFPHLIVLSLSSHRMHSSSSALPICCYIWCVVDPIIFFIFFFLLPQASSIKSDYVSQINYIVWAYAFSIRFGLWVRWSFQRAFIHICKALSSLSLFSCL